MARRIGIAAVLLAAVACTGDEADTTVVSTAAPMASELAPSQTSASTIVAPALPPPCTVGQLTFAQGPSDETGVVLVEITNTADAWCEANLSRSVAVAPEMEPDVWIDPGAVALLRVELDTSSCDDVAPVDTLGLDVNGEPVAVDIDPVEVCAVALTALSPR